MGPSVYIQHPRYGSPAYLFTCEDLSAAINLAQNVRDIFGRPAWVADFYVVAHRPTRTEQALEARHRGDHATADRLHAERDREIAELMDRR